MIEAEGLQSFQIATNDFRLDASANREPQRRKAVEANRRQLGKRGGGDKCARNREKKTTHGHKAQINSGIGRPSARIGIGRLAWSWKTCL
jgi:hypothetical protein